MSFGEEIKEEMTEMKKDIKRIQSESLAYDILLDQRKQNKRMFVVWIITFVAFIGLLSYTIYLLNDIDYVETNETSESYDINQNSGDGGNNNFINGSHNEVNNG